MTARQTLTILCEIGDLDAKRALLVAELRRAVADDELDRMIATDPVLRQIFEPAENLIARLGKSEVIEAGGMRYYLKNKNPRCVDKENGCHKEPDCRRADQCLYGEMEF